MASTTGERELYQPSNGTEGMAFFDAFCDRCIKQPKCQIIGATMLHDPGDPEYPEEWTWEPVKVETASCSAFVQDTSDAKQTEMK